MYSEYPKISGLSKIIGQPGVIRIIGDFLNVRNIRIAMANPIIEGLGYADPSVYRAMRFIGVIEKI
jgi:hypothetical protein